MIRLIVSVLLLFAWGGALAFRPVQSSDPSMLALTLDRVPVQQLVMLFYDQCEKRGLVFDPALDKLDQTLTIKTPRMTCSDTRSVLVDALQRAGVAMVSRGSYDFVTRVAEREESDGWKDLIYRPRFRDALELAQMVQIGIRKGAFAHQRRGSQVQVSAQSQHVPESGSNGASLTAKPIDKLVFVGPPSEVKAVESLLSRLDVPYPQIELQASIFEFQRGESEADAVTAALKLFGSRFGVLLNGGALANSSELKISLPNFTAALDVLDRDSRFRYVSRPKVLVKDGEEVSFTAGQDVRVVGQTVVGPTGQATQSITTVTAGVTLTATPFIRGDVVDVALHQLVSDFAPSPNSDVSIVRRDLTSRLMMEPGFVYVVGGLQTSRRLSARSSVLGLPLGGSADRSETELLLLLTVRPDVTVGARVVSPSD